MGWLEFMANVIESLAWPAAIAMAVVLLRKQLRGLIARLRKASYRGAEVELFGEAVEEAEKVAVGAALPPEQEHLIVGGPERGCSNIAGPSGGAIRRHRRPGPARTSVGLAPRTAS
jgi:hypothetical protein